MPQNDTTGALPPEDATFQIGCRADKMCVQAAVDLLFERGIVLPFIVIQDAIDAYLAQANKHGWNLR